jgi:hypothetical protein
MAHDIEMRAIPQFLGLSDPLDAHITSIQPINGIKDDSYEYLPGLYALTCYINVTWSNGQVERYSTFHIEEDRYGQIRGYYKPYGQ